MSSIYSDAGLQHDIQARVEDVDEKGNNILRHVQVADEMDKALGDLSGLDLAGKQVLVGVYVRGSVTPNGIVMSTGSKEDIWQGKVVRVLRFGGAITEGERKAPLGPEHRPIEVGDWLFSRVEDSFQLSFKGPGAVASKLVHRVLDVPWPCRLIYLPDVYGRLVSPNLIV